ncbi:pS183L [African swine fever virus]|uniref:PS183L n=1 Tax=African swine fever virus TaxID=10497 RepID=A0A894KS51_ASF|nr:pS183L [African swine fever virus]
MYLFYQEFNIQSQHSLQFFQSQDIPIHFFFQLANMFTIMCFNITIRKFICIQMFKGLFYTRIKRFVVCYYLQHVCQIFKMVYIYTVFHVVDHVCHILCPHPGDHKVLPLTDVSSFFYKIMQTFYTFKKGAVGLCPQNAVDDILGHVVFAVWILLYGLYFSGPPFYFVSCPVIQRVLHASDHNR